MPIPPGLLYPASKRNKDFGNKIRESYEAFARTDISLLADARQTIYLKIWRTNHHPIKFDLTLRRLDFYQHWDFVKTTRRDWLFIGFLITVAIINFLFFTGTRDLTFLYHGLFISGCLLYWISFCGVLADIPLIKDHQSLVPYIDYTVLTMMGVSYIQFIRYFLDLAQLSSKWDLIFRSVIKLHLILFAGMIGIYFFTVREPLVDKILAYVLIFEFLLILVFLVRLLRIKKKTAYFLSAGSLFFIGTVVLSSYSMLQGQSAWENSIFVGLTGEIFFFSLGLGYRMQELRKEKEKAIRLKELDDFKTKLYANITHEFRTPLTVISGVSDESQSLIDKDDRKRTVPHF